MSGDRLAASAIAAAAVAERAPDDFSVLAFSDKVMVIKGQDQRRSVDDVVEDVFRLRGHGPTDLGLALRVAADQLASSTAQRKRVVLLSDCRPTKGTEPERDAGGLDELHVIAPAEDSDDAEAFARAVGARFAALSGPEPDPLGVRPARRLRAHGTRPGLARYPELDGGGGHRHAPGMPSPGSDG